MQWFILIPMKTEIIMMYIFEKIDTIPICVPWGLQLYWRGIRVNYFVDFVME
jgi:hypothetical protein